MNTYYINERSLARPSITIEADRYFRTEEGDLAFFVGDNEVARFANGAWLNVVMEQS